MVRVRTCERTTSRYEKEVQVIPAHVLNAMNHRPKTTLQDFTEKSIDVLKNACPFWNKLYEHQKVGVAKAVIEFKEQH